MSSVSTPPRMNSSRVIISDFRSRGWNRGRGGGTATGGSRLDSSRDPGTFVTSDSWRFRPRCGVARALTGDRRTSSEAHTHTFNGPLSGTTQVSRYQKGKTNLDFTEARDSEWQWHQLQVCTSLQTDNHTNNLPLSFLQAGCPSCRPTNSANALKAQTSSEAQI